MAYVMWKKSEGPIRLHNGKKSYGPSTRRSAKMQLDLTGGDHTRVAEIMTILGSLFSGFMEDENSEAGT